MDGGPAGDAGPNAEQAKYWNSEAAPRWIAFQEALDQRFTALSEALIRRAGVGPGDRVVDVGCGTGATTLLLYRAYIDPPGFVPNWLARSTFRRELPQMLKDLRRRCEAEQTLRATAGASPH